MREARLSKRDPARAPQGEEAFQLLVESVQDYAIFMLDPSGRVVTWNSGAKRIKGWSASEIVGQHFSVFYPPEDRAAGKPARLLAEAIRNGRVEDESWRVRKDGSRFIGNVTITALHDQQGQLRGFAKVTKDMSERLHAASTLRASEERFRLLVESVQDYAIFMLDPAGNVASWNAGAERIKGYRADEIIGHNFEEFYLPEDRESRKPARELEQAGRDGRVEDEGWRVRKDGSRFWANVVITALRDEAGDLVGFAKVTRDTTEQKRHELQVEEAERVKADFLNLAAHELRGPLTVIAGYLSMIEDGTLKPGPLLSQAMHPLRAKAEDMNRLINQMLEVARLDYGGGLKMVQEPHDLRRLVGNAVEAQLLPAGGRHSLHVEAGSEVVPVLVDANRVRLILDNLLSNAVKYSPSGGETTCRIWTHNGTAHVEISDEGVGIAPEDQPKLFRRFGRITGRGLDHIPGIGLGLYLAREMALLHGGDIRVESALGKGSRFVLTLPLAS